MNWKRIGKALLFPHMAVMIMLLSFAAVLLIYSMIFVGAKSPVSYVSYALAAYTLTVWCVRIPYLIRFYKSFQTENRYARRWLEDARLRVKLSLYSTLVWNTAYAVFQLGLGFWHGSFWFCSLAGYYLCLAVMRFFLLRYTVKHKAGEKLREELKKYRACGIALLLMNLALSLMIFFMIYWNRTFHHHEITTITMAAYTFTALALAIVNMVKYRKYNSPVYSAANAVRLASACVSMLTLETTMLTTFGDETTDLLTRGLLLGISGGVICLLIITMALFMIVRGSKKIKLLSKSKEQPNG